MRATLDLDEDLLQVARKIAQQRGVTIGQIVSDLARKGLASNETVRVRNGVPLFTPRLGARKPHLDLVNQLRDAPQT